MPIGAILNDAETKGIQYVDTIEAYNQWAEVSALHTPTDLFRGLYAQ
jgi:hypothetical protein